MNNYKGVVFLLFLSAISFESSFAQCAMCKATAESSLENGESVASGINFGILYLLPIPYIILGTIAYLYYKSYKKESLTM